jgi:hypothetical protein
MEARRAPRHSPGSRCTGHEEGGRAQRARPRLRLYPCALVDFRLVVAFGLEALELLHALVASAISDNTTLDAAPKLMCRYLHPFGQTMFRRLSD